MCTARVTVLCVSVCLLIILLITILALQATLWLMSHISVLQVLENRIAIFQILLRLGDSYGMKHMRSIKVVW